ncbi:hypothetical protein CSPX01_04989 [Colletotrichum filicis]|nr:hypothetical protein CSPX01_04989 [Colletotrichum filicis]
MVAAFGILASIRHHTGSLFVFATCLNLDCFESELMSEVWIRRRDSSGVYLCAGSTLDLGTKNGVFRCRQTTPVWTGAHRMAPIATVPDGTRVVACSEITPGVWYWLVLSPFLRRMGTAMPVIAWGKTRSPDVCIAQDRGGIAVGKGKETMSRKAKRYFGTGYQVRIKVAVSLKRVSRWMETWQVMAILMTIFSIRLRAASCAGLGVMTSRFWIAARGFVAVSVAAHRRAITGMGGRRGGRKQR